MDFWPIFVKLAAERPQRLISNEDSEYNELTSSILRRHNLFFENNELASRCRLYRRKNEDETDPDFVPLIQEIRIQFDEADIPRFRE